MYVLVIELVSGTQQSSSRAGTPLTMLMANVDARIES